MLAYSWRKMSRYHATLLLSIKLADMEIPNLFALKAVQPRDLYFIRSDNLLPQYKIGSLQHALRSAPADHGRQNDAQRTIREGQQHGRLH